MDEPANIVELLDRIATTRGQLSATIAQLSSEQLVAPVLHGGLSVKDELAHVIFWEYRMCYALRPRSEGGTDRTNVPPEIADIAYSANWTDEVNQRVFLNNRERATDLILEEYERSGFTLVERIASLAAELFTGDIEATEALGLIADNTYEHYNEHTTAIRAAFG